MRQLHTVSLRDWGIILEDTADGDLQVALTLELDQYTPGPRVAYTTDSLGGIDSESSPFYAVDVADDSLAEAFEACDGEIEL